ncbi:MAG: hypothetical protein LUE14_05385 [Clostridiales bacterium]|nr:hypothetical protein [Clostridiales bacterium]
MAINDWNGDGKNDRRDDFIEYHIMNGDSNPESGSGHKSGEMSTIGIILCVMSGIVEEALLYMLLGIEVKNVPGLVMLLLWVVFSFITFLVVMWLKEKL